MDKINIHNLSGKCLAAMPGTEGSFAKALVYVCSHSEEGAMGFIVNKPYTNVSFNELSFDLLFGKSSNQIIPIFQGGPLEREKGFIIHDDSYKDSSCLSMGDGIRISSSPDILQHIATGMGPERFLIALGYAGWAPGQLEAEISQNMWMITPATQEIIFHTQVEDKWSMALSSLGINETNLTIPLGHS